MKHAGEGRGGIAQPAVRVSPPDLPRDCGRFETIDSFLPPKESQWLDFGRHWAHPHHQNVSCSDRQVVDGNLDHVSAQEQVSS